MEEVLKQLLARLNSNTELKEIVTSINPFGVYDKNKMYYKFMSLTSDRIKAQGRFELTAICDSYSKSIKAIEQAKKSLLTLADEKLTDDILTVVVNGGGSLRDKDAGTFHELANFTITYKERL